MTPTPTYVTAAAKAREQFGRNPITGNYPQATEWRPDDERWVRARSARGTREGGVIKGMIPTREDKVDAWVDAPMRARIETPSSMASRRHNMWDLLGPNYEPPSAYVDTSENQNKSVGSGSSGGGGGGGGGAEPSSSSEAVKEQPQSTRPFSAPAYRPPKPPPPRPPPPVKPSQNIITNHLPFGTAPRETNSTLEREQGGGKSSPAKPSIKEINAAREREARDREARARAIDLTRVDKPHADAINGVCVPSDVAPSYWVETTELQKNRDVAYRGRTHDVEAHYLRRRNKDSARDSARINNRFVRTDHIRHAEVARRGYNILTGQVEERRMVPTLADVPLVTPRQ